MKVFISWSGNKSKHVAEVLKSWLEDFVFEFLTIEFFFSDSDIEIGEQWLNRLNSELESTSIGIICISKENQTSPWIIFEAGCIFKALEKNRIIPFVIDFDKADLSSPISSFQSVNFNKEDISKMVSSIFAALDKTFNPKKFESFYSVLVQEMKYIGVYEVLYLERKEPPFHRKNTFLRFDTLPSACVAALQDVNDSIKNLDIFALNTQTLSIHFSTHPNIQIDNLRILLPSKEAIECFYKTDSFPNINKLNAIDEILHSKLVALSIWGGMTKNLEVRYVNFFPINYFFVISNEKEVFGKYYFKKDDKRHGLSLGECFVSIIDNNENDLSIWFEKAWDIATI